MLGSNNGSDEESLLEMQRKNNALQLRWSREIERDKDVARLECVSKE